MITVKTDDRRRVSLPGAKPKQRFAYAEKPNGVIVLTPIKRPDPDDMSAVAADTWEKLGPAPTVNYAKIESR